MQKLIISIVLACLGTHGVACNTDNLLTNSSDAA